MTSTNDESAGTAESSNSKVARLIEKYQLGEGYGDRLENLWTADRLERESLHSLADRFNQRLLEAAIADAGDARIEGEVENLYQLLTSEDVSSGNRTEARNRLERQGVDIDQLENDFVTYQAIRFYLTEFRGVEYDQNSEDNRIDNIIETIQRLQSRTSSVAEKNLEQLKNTNRLSLGEFRIFIDIDVLCEDCDMQYGIVELLREGGCDCEAE